MIAIVFKRQHLQDESLLLTALNEDGEIRKIKIPGIVKSKKRSAFFLVPGTIWHFTISNAQKEISIPKESTLVCSPFSTETTFKQLDAVAELVAPLELLLPGVEQNEIFELLKLYINKWQGLPESLQQELLNHFILFFLDQMGQLLINENCAICERKLTKTDYYLMHEGGVCSQCIAERSELIEGLISWGWVVYYAFNFFERTQPFFNDQTSQLPFAKPELYEHEIFKNSQSYRQLIMAFLKQTLA